MPISLSVDSGTAALVVRSSTKMPWRPVPLHLTPAFDLQLHEMSPGNQWCVRYTREHSGDDGVPVCEVYDGPCQDILTGLEVDGVRVTESAADSAQHRVRGYLAALFAAAPAMRQEISDAATWLREHRNHISPDVREGYEATIDGLENLLRRIYTDAKDC